MPEVELETQETEEINFYELLNERGLDDAERVLQEPFSCFVKKMPELELETVETKETEIEETMETEETYFSGCGLAAGIQVNATEINKSNFLLKKK